MTLPKFRLKRHVNWSWPHPIMFGGLTPDEKKAYDREAMRRLKIARRREKARKRK